MSKPPRQTDDQPSHAVARPKSVYSFLGGFDANELLGLNRAFEDIQRAIVSPIAKVQFDTLGGFAMQQPVFPIPKWENPVTIGLQRQIDDITRSIYPRTSMLPDDLFPWMKQLDFTPAWMKEIDLLSRGFLGSQTATSTRARRTADDKFLREADALLDATEEDQSDEILPPTILDAIIDDLEASLTEDSEDDLEVLPEDLLEETSGANNLTPLRALYRLVVHLRPDIRHDPLLHRILRRAAGGSVVATMLLIMWLNPALFVVLMNVVGAVPMYAVGTAAVDKTMARGEKPRSSKDTHEKSEDEPEQDEDKDSLD